VPANASVVHHFLNDCSTDFPAIFYHVGKTHFASFEADTLLILPVGASEKFSGKN
jgi:hypothetical protein